MNNQEKKLFIPVIVAIVAFIIEIVANGLIGLGYDMRWDFSDNISFGNTFIHLVLALILPAAYIVLIKSKKFTQKNVHILLIVATVFIAIQGLGNLIELLDKFGGAGELGEMFYSVPGSIVLANMVNIFLEFAGMIGGYYIFAALIVILGSLLLIISSCAYLISNFCLILMCSEFENIPQLEGIRKTVYNLAKIQTSEFNRENESANTEISADTDENISKNEEINIKDNKYFCKNDIMETYGDANKYQFNQEEINPELKTCKGIAISIVLTLITCGIYAFVWIYSIMKKIKLLNNDYSSCIGEFLCFIFVPFYSLYWFYTRAEKLSVGAGKYGITMQNNGTMYILLQIFALALVNICLMQNDLNTLAKIFSGTTTNYNTTQVMQANNIVREPNNEVKEDDVMSQIRELAKMHKEGIITDEEFNLKKEELLKRI